MTGTRAEELTWTPIDKAWRTGSTPDLIVDLAQQLIAIPSQNPPGKEKAVAEFIHQVLSQWGIEVERVDEPDPARPQIVARVGGPEPGATLILNGLMDTVGEGDPAAWRHAPFAASHFAQK